MATAGFIAVNLRIPAGVDTAVNGPSRNTRTNTI